jgi:hypothetical protein
MFNVGFDSIPLKKKFAVLDSFMPKKGEANATSETELTVLKGLVGASVTSDSANLMESYQNAIRKALDKFQIRQQKILYKGAHLLKQVGDKTEEIICDVLNELEPAINHIDLYTAFYEKKFISQFGRAQGQRLNPMTFIDKNENSFAHACAWWYWKTYAKYEDEYMYHIDHFQGNVTPAWRELENNKVKLSVYYSGSECNCLISLSDLILKLIEIFHFGPIDYRSVARPLLQRCSNFASAKKIRSHDLARFDWIIRATVPDTPLNINLNQCLKHPIYFIVWSPALPRNTVKPSFEWSIFYNSVIEKAIENNGCVKFLDFDKDMTFWDDIDYLVPWTDIDENHVKLLNDMGFSRMPQTIKIEKTN